MSLEIMARRIAETRKRNGFITPASISIGGQAHLVTQRDLMLVHLGRALSLWMEVTHAIGNSSSPMMRAMFARLIRELQRTSDLLDQYDETRMVPISDRDAMFGKLALIVEELGEAAQCASEDNEHAFWTEIADALIRELDLAGTAGINLTQIVQDKMQKNENRAPRHGKKKFL